jgi:hypothetical protein
MTQHFTPFGPRRREPLAVKPVVEAKTGIVCEPVTLLHVRSSHCRWILGDTRGPKTLFCGRQKYRHSSYCEPHFRLATVRGARRAAP